jgi:caa(3)-type oxidase subunit IV
MANEQRPERRTLFIVYFCLLILLALSAVGAKVPLPAGLHTIWVYSIATISACLLVLIFMEVRYQHGLTRVFVGAGLVWLFLMFLLTLNDYFTRSWRF